MWERNHEFEIKQVGGIWKGLEVAKVPVGSPFATNLFQVSFFTLFHWNNSVYLWKKMCLIVSVLETQG